MKRTRILIALVRHWLHAARGHTVASVERIGCGTVLVMCLTCDRKFYSAAKACGHTLPS